MAYLRDCALRGIRHAGVCRQYQVHGLALYSDHTHWDATQASTPSDNASRPAGLSFRPASAVKQPAHPVLGA